MNKKILRKSLKNFSKIIFNIISFILILIIIIELSFIFQTKVLNKDYGEVFGYSIFTIASGSMFPTIDTGDSIIVKITQDVTVGDIVLFKDEENDVLIAHREIKDNGDTITTKGDNNNIEDDEIDKDLIIGKVVLIIPKLGIIQSLLIKPYIIIPILDFILIISLIISLVKEKEQ